VIVLLSAGVQFISVSIHCTMVDASYCHCLCAFFIDTLSLTVKHYIFVAS